MSSRREFLIRTGSLALLSSSGRWIFGSQNVPPAERKKILVFIVLRGAMDGLHAVAPLGDPAYATARPNLRLRREGNYPPMPLDGYFFLHPALKAIHNLWKEKSLAIIHQVGSPETTRSHFEAQDFLETGAPGQRTITEGFLNRALTELGGGGSEKSALAAIALQPTLPRVLRGPFSAIAMASTRDFNLRDGKIQQARGFEDLYGQATDRVFQTAGQQAFEGLNTAKSLNRDRIQAQNRYPQNEMGRRLSEIAFLIHSDIGMHVAVTEMSGWDTHVNQGGTEGQLANRFRDFAEALAAFRADLGKKFEDVCIVTETEFGRTVHENGDRGTDHGHGGVMLVMGGNVKGGRVLGNWKDLKRENLFEGRDVPVTTDYRTVWTEVLDHHWGLKQTRRVFPNFTAPGNLGLFI